MGMKEIVIYTEYCAFSLRTFWHRPACLQLLSPNLRLSHRFNALGQYCDSSGDMPCFDQGVTQGTDLPYLKTDQWSIFRDLNF